MKTEGKTKVNVSKAARDYAEANPGMGPTEIANYLKSQGMNAYPAIVSKALQATGGTKPGRKKKTSVKKVDGEAPKKRGRPAGSKNKAKKAGRPAAKKGRKPGRPAGKKAGRPAGRPKAARAVAATFDMSQLQATAEFIRKSGSVENASLALKSFDNLSKIFGS